MNKSNFRSAQFDIGVLFAERKTYKQLEQIFSKLTELSTFNGVKKIEKASVKKNKGNADRCVLTSDDNKFKLVLTNKDCSVIFYNEELEIEIRKQFQKVSEVFSNLSFLNSSDIEMARFRHMIFSTSKIDKERILSAYFKESSLSDVEQVNFLVNFDKTNFENIDIEESINVLTDRWHPQRLHDAYTAKTKKKKFEPLILYHINAMRSDVSAAHIQRYLTQELENNLTMTILDRIGDD